VATTGHMVQGQLSGRPRTDPARRGFTLIELLVVIAIIALLVSILVPSLSRARDLAKQVMCKTNQHALGVAINMYAVENRDEVPQAFGALGAGDPGYYTWACASRAGNYMYYADKPLGLALLYESKQVADPSVFYCPSMKDDVAGGFKYGWSSTGTDVRDRSYSRSSYYYRYVIGPGERSTGTLGQTADGHDIAAFNARIGRLQDDRPAALWDTYHATALNPGYHKEGYNILLYSQTVVWLDASFWGWFPSNVWWDWTDCWGLGSDAFYIYADRAARE